MNREFLKHLLQEKVASLQHAAESWSPQHVLKWAFESFSQSVAIASAFGPEGMAVIDMAAHLRGADFRLFTLDTEFLFPDTYSLMDRIEQKYGITIERVYSPLSPEEQERVHGAALWNRDPDVCCNLRKVAPLRQKLSELSAWITGIRREQTPDRAGALKIGWDSKFDIVKINPIADWNSAQVWRYICDHDVPYNPLHDRGYPSIGCKYCTRAVLPGEDQRNGRWSGFAKNECGLHVIEQAPVEQAVSDLGGSQPPVEPC
jgi:phosphoadenosine phosphosulfate reductase